jgi:hypothetical protein
MDEDDVEEIRPRKSEKTEDVSEKTSDSDLDNEKII